MWRKGVHMIDQPTAIALSIRLAKALNPSQTKPYIVAQAQAICLRKYGFKCTKTRIERLVPNFKKARDVVAEEKLIANVFLDKPKSKAEPVKPKSKCRKFSNRGALTKSEQRRAEVMCAGMSKKKQKRDRQVEREECKAMLKGTHTPKGLTIKQWKEHKLGLHGQNNFYHGFIPG
jgi:hypothetical protein